MPSPFSCDGIDAGSSISACVWCKTMMKPAKALRRHFCRRGKGCQHFVAKRVFRRGSIASLTIVVYVNLRSANAKWPCKRRCKMSREFRYVLLNGRFCDSFKGRLCNVSTIISPFVHQSHFFVVFRQWNDELNSPDGTAFYGAEVGGLSRSPSGCWPVRLCPL